MDVLRRVFDYCCSGEKYERREAGDRGWRKMNEFAIDILFRRIALSSPLYMYTLKILSSLN